MSCVDITLSRGHRTLAVDDMGDIYFWGDFSYYGRNPKISVPQKAVSVSNDMILTQSGLVFLLHYHDSDDTSLECIKSLAQHRIVQISAGGFYTLFVETDAFRAAISDKGLLFLWGNNYHGQCAANISETDRIEEPTHVKLFDSADKTELIPSHIQCGLNHCLLITTCGLIMSWGWRHEGKLGDGERAGVRFTPEVIDALRDYRVVDIAVGSQSSFSIDGNGDAWSWGWGALGQLGHTEDLNEPVTTPKRIEFFVENGIKIKQCTAGHESSAVITLDGELYVFGCDELGQLGIDGNVGFREGLGETNNIPTKIKVSDDPSVKVVKVVMDIQYGTTAVIAKASY